MLGNPAAERNKQPILEVLQKYIPVEKTLKMLEISSGVGLHASYFGQFFPQMIIQTSEYEEEIFHSINEYRKNFRTSNVLSPVFIDISKDTPFEENSFDFMMNINMMHISPFTCSEGLFRNSSKILKKDGILFTYGPYACDGILEPETNISFDQTLRKRNSTWGIRDIADLKKIAAKNAMELAATFNLPSNNKCLVWKKI